MENKTLDFLNKNISTDFLNKTIIITGGNSGIGLATAKICAYYKMNIFLAVRSLSRGEKAKEEIIKEYPEAKVEVLELDVSNEKSIINLVNLIKERNIDIDYFYNNAGILNIPYQVKDKKELTISTNYYGPFILTSLLLDYFHALKHDVKVLYTTSVAVTWTKVNEKYFDPNYKASNSKRYSCSKSMNAYLCKYMSEHEKSNIHYYLVHPGVVITPLVYKAYPKWIAKAGEIFMKPFSNNAETSALATMVALDDKAKEGVLYGPSKLFNIKGLPNENKFINKYYIDVDKYILLTEKTLGYKLI